MSTMKIANTVPFKVTLIAASITTIGLVAFAMMSTTSEPVRDHCELRKRPASPPQPQPEPVRPESLQPS